MNGDLDSDSDSGSFEDFAPSYFWLWLYWGEGYESGSKSGGEEVGVEMKKEKKKNVFGKTSLPGAKQGGKNPM